MSFQKPKELTARHLNGIAAVYTRQSTKKQDEENRGSLEYQRGQARHARAWGFPADRIKLYEDPGLTGSSSEHRPAFLAMKTGMKDGTITVVLASDQSRLARNTIEWIEFLTLCRKMDVVLVLDGRIVNLGGDGGDDFTSTIVALVDEYDLQKRRGHIMRGIAGRLDDGKAVSNPPTGLLALNEKAKGDWILDPDPQVQAAIRATFRIFLEERSCARTVRRFLAEGMKVPAKKPGRDLVWVAPSIMTIRRILKNPSYCGDYVYRRRVADPSRGKDGYGHWRVRTATEDEMRIISGHHPAYVTRETWQDVQRILRLHAPSKVRRNPGPGAALLQGIIRCGKHPNRLSSVDYKEKLRDGRNGAHYYHCVGTYWQGGSQCGALPGRALDVAVARAVFARLTRPCLETLRGEWNALQASDVDGTVAREAAVAQARREVEALEARYRRMTPQLLDLAERIEAQLNEALATLKRAQAAAASGSDEDTFFTEDAFEELAAFCEDLPGLFYATTTNDQNRKEIMRTMVGSVVVQKRTETTITATVFWSDGSEPTSVEAHLVRHVHRLIRELGDEGVGNSEIARRVNEMGFVTSRRKAWTRETIWNVRFKLGRG